MAEQSPMQFARVVGKKAFLGFFVVTSLVVWVLVTTSIVTKYAIKSYTEDQLRHVVWDSVVYQSQDLPLHQQVTDKIVAVEGVERVEKMGLLRIRLNPNVPVVIGGQEAFIPWFSIVSASAQDGLPSELRLEDSGSNERVTVVMFGPQKIIKPYLDRISVGSDLAIKYKAGGQEMDIFSAQIGKISQIDRTELVKWIMGQVGSAAYVPQLGLMVVVPPKRLNEEIVRLGDIFKRFKEGVAGEEETGEVRELNVSYAPEVMHLVLFKRSSLFSGWDLEGSLERVKSLVDTTRANAREVNYNALVNSDLLVTLEKMVQNSKLVGLVTLLISIPILCMVWILASNLASLISLNERRVIGLLRLRGASGKALMRALTLSISGGGVAGSLVGVVIGNLVPMFVYRISPSLMAKISDASLLLVFVAVGVIVGYLSGQKVTRYATKITPLEASARVSSSEMQVLRPQFTNFQLLAFLIGCYKVGLWIADYTPQVSVLQNIDTILNFLAAPLFIYGCTALVISRSAMIARLLSALASPIAGNLKLLVVKNLLMRPHRVASAILIASLMFSIALYPKITADSFEDKTIRGVKVNLGSDLVFSFNTSDLTGGELTIKGVSQQLARVSPMVEDTIRKITSVKGVEAAYVIYELTVPGSFYIPGHSSLPLYLVPNVPRYLELTYHEEDLGVGQSFSESIGTLNQEEINISKGLVDLGKASVGSSFVLGRKISGEDFRAQVGGAITVLPGASRLMLENREAYSSSDIDFINHLARANPFVVASADGKAIGALEGILSRLVVLVKVSRGDAAAVSPLIESALLPLKPASKMDLSDQVGKLGKDMFVSLALESMKVYMLGGIMVALAGILAIGIANFIELRRNLALLRVRGGSPNMLFRVVIADFLVPVFFGTVIGISTGLLTGYGLTNFIFKVPRVLSILEALKVHLVLPILTWGIVVLLLFCFAAVAVVFGLWTFRRTARESLSMSG